MQTQKIWNTTLYLRFSRDDGDKEESNSITGQRELLRDYLMGHPELREYAVRVDDGWSGSTFERPSFQAMIEDVKAGRADCIVFKDLFRFGRDYLVVGNYISRVFPFMGVRFIAVNDNFDSSRPQDIDSLDTSFKTLIYDLYSRELSAKVKAAKKMRAEKGLFLSPFAPYGYVKDPEDKNHLLVDEEAAQIIRKIFTLIAKGRKLSEIASMMNRDGVLTPMLYKRSAGCSRTRWPSVHEENFWTPSCILKIIRDERYIEKCIYGKRERDRVGHFHTVKHSKAEWIVVDETHEGIVSKELFDKAQAQIREYIEYSAVASKRNILLRKVRCGSCGFAMSLSNHKNAKYFCRMAHLETGHDCSSEGIPQDDIHEMIVTLIRTYAAYAVSLEQLVLLQKEQMQAEAKQARRELAVLQSKKAQLEKSLQELYEKLIDGNMDKESYLSHKSNVNKQMQELDEKINALENTSRTITPQGGAFIEKYKEYTELETLTPEIAQDIVNRVTVYHDGRIEIELALRDELEAVLSALDVAKSVS